MIERAAAAGWDLVPYRYRGEQAGLAAVKGSEIHFELTRPASIFRHAAREFLGELLKREGFLTTRCEPRDTRARRFIERLGFKATWSDGNYDYFMLTELPFGKEN